MIAAGEIPGAAPPIEAHSPAMLAVIRTLAKLAACDFPVLFRGESGAGKSTLARTLHASSSRSTRDLVTVDCLTLQDDTPEQARVFVAKVEEALGGTIFFEEIGALSGRLQAAVSSLLERPGATKRFTDVRVVAASHLHLEAAVQAGRFREDLLTRLGVMEIQVPPLRDRREDILPLARCFLDSFTHGSHPTMANVTLSAQRALVAYSWPGNIRQLRNTMHRAVVLSQGSILDLDAFPSIPSAPDH